MQAVPAYVLYVRVAGLLVALALTLATPPLPALADQPSPSSAPTVSPPPKPPPSSPPSPSPSPTASPGATPEPTPSVAPEVEAIDATVADRMRRTIAATSLAERIDAQRRLAEAEREFLVREIARIREERAGTARRLADLRQQLAEKRAVLDRLMEETYKSSRVSPLEALLRRVSIVDALIHVDDLARLSVKQRDTTLELREIERRLALEHDAAQRREADLLDLQASVAAKDASLRKLASWADALVRAAESGAASDARIEVLRELADEVAREHEATERVIAEIAQRAGGALPSPGRWTWPLNGVVTQEFGPSALTLEPPMTYRGVAYPHFHDGIDIAAALGAPVRAVARGRVAFVGHLGGAMVVIVAHQDGLISLYGHLDDAALRPAARVGDTVEAGQTIGAVGLTGLTTGPHLHLSLRKGTEPLDPRGVLGTPPTSLPSSRP
jgi:murein DD-endopeptidase MepM/ murein hydrolase activator NlpD